MSVNFRTSPSTFPEVAQSLSALQTDLNAALATIDSDITAVEGDIATIQGDITTINGLLSGAVNRTYVIPMLSFRQASMYTELSLSYGAIHLVPILNWTTDKWYLETIDAAGAQKANYAYCEFALPPRYSAAGDVTVTLRAKVTAAMHVSQYVDLEAKEIGDGAMGADICATDHQAITDAWANYAFTVTPTGLVAGDVLALKVGMELDDTDGSGEKHGQITKVTVTCEETL